MVVTGGTGHKGPDPTSREGTREVVNRGLVIKYLLVSLCIAAVQRTLITVQSARVLVSTHQPMNVYKLFVSQFVHWDAGWYVHIAQRGYRNITETAFFPAYPVAMRLFHEITGLGLATSGVIISALSFIAALWCLGLLVDDVFGVSVAIRAMALCALFPTAYYFVAVYTESLFLFFTLGAVLAARRGHFWLASLLVASATLTRNTGVILSLILLFEYIRSRQLGWHFWSRRWRSAVDWNVLSLAVAPLVLFAYLCWLKVRFGHFLAFVVAERHWHRVFMPPWSTFVDTFRLVARGSFISFPQYFLLELGAMSFVVVLLVLSLRTSIRSLTLLSWWLYTLISIWMVTTEPSINVPDYLVSLPRYVLMLFPVPIYLAVLLKNRWVTAWTLMLFAGGMIKLAAMFAQKVWIA